MSDEKKDEEIQGITGIKLDDQKKRNNTAKTIENAIKINKKPMGVEANIKMEKKLKIKPAEEREGVQAHLEEHRKYIQRTKPRLPKKLIILSVEWDILYRNNSYEVDLHKQGKYWGQTDFDNNEIRILKAGRKTEAIWCTLFHEILHIIFHHLDIDDILGNREENVTVALSSALNDFFWRNFSGR